jgi:uncharacterized membrane protein
VRPYIVFAVIAGLAWGVGGYFEKAGLKALGLPPIAGITLRTAVALVVLGVVSYSSWHAIAHPSDMRAWLMIVIGGGVVAGSLGMWSFYASLANSENLGVTLAVAFALSPIAGTVLGLVRGTQEMDVKTALGLLLIIAGIVLVQSVHTTQNR